MKQLKKLRAVLACSLVLAMVSPVVLPIGNVAVAEAKTKVATLDKSKATITVGKSVTLKVTGTTSKVTWKSSNAKIAKVTQAGKVTGVKAGSAVITATVDKKKLTCKVTVKKAAVTNPYTEKTSYESQVATNGKVNYVIPKSWISEANPQAPQMIAYYHKDADTTKAMSNIIVSVSENTDKVSYEILKTYYKDLIDSQVNAAKVSGTTINNYTITDYNYDHGVAMYIDLSGTSNGTTVIQKFYITIFDNYVVYIQSNGLNDGTTPDPATVALDMLNSLQVTK